MPFDTNMYGRLDPNMPMKIGDLLSPATREAQQLDRMKNQEQAAQFQEARTIRDLMRGSPDLATAAQRLTSAGMYDPAMKLQGAMASQQDMARKAAERQAELMPTDEALINVFRAHGIPEDRFQDGMREFQGKSLAERKMILAGKSAPQVKQELVEIQDPNDPNKTVKVWATPGQSGGVVVGSGKQPDWQNPAYVATQKDIRKAGAAGPVTVSVSGDKGFKNEMDLRKEFNGLPIQKAFTEVQSAYDQINAALARPSPASDLAAATKIMKLLDPGSVVRESELGMAMQATGALDRVANYYNRMVTGQALTPSQRKDFGQLAQDLYTAASNRYDPVVSEYRDTAKEWGFNADRIVKPRSGSNMRDTGSGGKKVFTSRSGATIELIEGGE